MNITTIQARQVPANARMGTLPRHFGRYMPLVEGAIYDFLGAFARSYQGGYWEFYELSNGGFYMSPPDETYELRIASNGFAGEMSGDAAGITACLYTFSHLSFAYPRECFAQHFHALREFAAGHPQADLIFAAID